MNTNVSMGKLTLVAVAASAVLLAAC
ncbi:MAG: hypothetical protein RIQ97_2362, partial [Pseudomonadota bacterium]